MSWLLDTARSKHCAHKWLRVPGFFKTLARAGVGYGGHFALLKPPPIGGGFG
jgi:hypothetical protein